MKRTVDLQTGYTDLYPCRVDVALRAAETLPDAIGVRFLFDSPSPGFSHFLVSVNGEETESRDGDIVVRVAKVDATEPQEHKLVIRAVTVSGTISRPYEIHFSFYSRELYAAGGLTHKSQLILQYSDFIPMPTQVDDWTGTVVTDADRRYATEKWAALLAAEDSDYRRVVLLIRSLIDDLTAHRGIPSDAMKGLSGMEQYERVMAGEDEAWCGNLAAIFMHVANALNIPVRSMGMAHVAESTDQYDFRVAEGHATTEVFVADINQWVWVDLTFNLVGAYLGDVGPLNLVEFCMLLNNPARREHLYVCEYDSKSKVILKTAVCASTSWNAYIRFFKTEQRIGFSAE